MKMKSGFTVLKVAGDYVAAPVGAESKRTRAMIMLNETSAWLWNFFKEDHTAEEAATAICAEYEVDFETAKRDVDKFLQIFSEKGLLEI